MHHDGLPVPTGKSKPPTWKGGRSDPLTQTDMHHTHHMHHTSISIDMLGKHIATMLRHNPYSLLHSTARTNLVARSYPQFFFFFSFYFFAWFWFRIFVLINFFFFVVWFLSFVSHFVFFLSSLSLWTPFDQSSNTGPEIEIDFHQ